MDAFIKTEETEKQFENLKKDLEKLNEEIEQNQNKFRGLLTQKALLEIFIEDYNGYGLIWK